MGKNTKIEWCDHSWNPWQGCKKVSPGCANCYMYRDKKRFNQDPEKYTLSKTRTFFKPNTWEEPAKVFVCSWSDFFWDEVPLLDRLAAWKVIKSNQHLTFLILTKRPENMNMMIPLGGVPENVWLGVTAENQEMADYRIPILLRTPAKVHFVSVEPMLGEVDIKKYLYGSDVHQCLDWVICGGETGPKARHMFSGWAGKLKAQCNAASVSFFMKQMTNKKHIPPFLKSNEFPGV